MAVPLLAGPTAPSGRYFPAVRWRGVERPGSKAMESNRAPEFSVKFRGIERHLGRALSMADTVVLGARDACPAGAAVSLGNGAGKPVLGRYQIRRKLGKGATGDV